MKLIITGASGLVGRALLPALSASGHQVLPLSRTTSVKSSDCYSWNPIEQRINAKAFEGADAVVHLAGENIASGRWTVARKARILDSRVAGTRLITETIAHLSNPPHTLICASATGWYGNRGDEVLTEDSVSGRGFLADVCRGWEAAAEPARAKGVRVVNLRFGMILSRQGGALPKMLTPFKLGAGGIIGNGRQYWSWVTLDDVVRAILFAVEHDQLVGPVNVVSPNPVTNHEFTKTLGRVLHRPTLLPLPGFVARLVLGEMADELLLASARVQPARLAAVGFRFQHSELEEALHGILG